MLIRIVASLVLLGTSAGRAQAQQLIGAPCEGCEAVLESGDVELTTVDTLPGFHEDAPAMVMRGTIYEPDGVTPAQGVVLYIHQTNSAGVYPIRGDETGWGRRHGYYRGWVRTDASGSYQFHTARPGSYPDRSLPAHVHGMILEPNGDYYWIDEWNFVGDPLLRPEDLDARVSYGGSGLVEITKDDDVLVAERDIVLGERVPGYPARRR